MDLRYTIESSGLIVLSFYLGKFLVSFPYFRVGFICEKKRTVATKRALDTLNLPDGACAPGILPQPPHPSHRPPPPFSTSPCPTFLDLYCIAHSLDTRYSTPVSISGMSMTNTWADIFAMRPYMKSAHAVSFR